MVYLFDKVEMLNRCGFGLTNRLPVVTYHPILCDVRG